MTHLLRLAFAALGLAVVAARAGSFDVRAFGATGNGVTASITLQDRDGIILLRR